MNSDPFSQALVRRYCSLRPGSGCRLRSEERDATEEHEFSHIVLSAARPAASAATAVTSCSESTILPAAFGIVVSLHICERTRHDASTPPTGPLATDAYHLFATATTTTTTHDMCVHTCARKCSYALLFPHTSALIPVPIHAPKSYEQANTHAPKLHCHRAASLRRYCGLVPEAPHAPKGSCHRRCRDDGLITNGALTSPDLNGTVSSGAPPTTILHWGPPPSPHGTRSNPIGTGVVGAKVAFVHRMFLIAKK